MKRLLALMMLVLLASIVSAGFEDFTSKLADKPQANSAITVTHPAPQAAPAQRSQDPQLHNLLSAGLSDRPVPASPAEQHLQQALIAGIGDTAVPSEPALPQAAPQQIRQSLGVNAALVLVDHRGNERANAVDVRDTLTGLPVTPAPRGRYKVKVPLSNGRKIDFDDLEVDAKTLLRIEEFTLPGFANSIATDLTGLNFTGATYTAIAQQPELYKCKEWNFSAQSCEGSWVKVLDVVPGQQYSVTLGPDDPGFAEFNSSQRAGEINTTSTTPISAIQLNFSGAQSQFLVLGYGELQGSSQASNVGSALNLNGTDVIGNLSWQPDTSRTSNPPGDYQPFFSQDLRNLTGAATQNLSTQFFTSNAANVVFIRRARAAVFRVNNSDAVIGNTSEQLQTLTPAGTFHSVVNLSFRPAVNQSLLVLATAETVPNSTIDLVFARLTMNGTEVGIAQLASEAVGDVELFATHIFVNATANVTQNFSIQAQSQTNANKSIRRARIVVVPLGDVFANASEGISETTSSILQNKTFLFVNMSSPTDVLVIASADVNISSATNGDFLGADLAVDGVSMGNMTMGGSIATDVFSFITTEQQSWTNGTHTVRLGFNREAGAAGTVAIRRARITVIPLGISKINATLLTPPVGVTTNATQNTTFLMTANISCVGGVSCGNVTVFALYNFTHTTTSINRVIRGTVSLTQQNQTVDLATAVNTNMSILFFSTEEDTTTPGGGHVLGVFLNTTTLKFFRTSATPSINVTWSVAEFSAGVTVYNKTTALGTAGVESVVPIGTTAGTTVNVSSSFIVPAGLNESGTVWNSNDFIRARLVNATHIGIIALAAANDVVDYTNYQVVEYNGSSVQRGLSDMLTGVNTLNVTLSNVTNTSRSFLIFTYQEDQATITNNALVSGRILNGTLIQFARNSSATGIINISWEVTQLPAGSVQHAMAAFQSNETEQNITLTSVNTNNTVAFASGGPNTGLSTGSNTNATASNIGHSLFMPNITSATNLRINRAPTGDQAYVGWFVVQFANVSFEDFTNISTLANATPFFTTSANPQTCILNTGQNCVLNWTVNATNTPISLFKLGVNASSPERSVVAVFNGNATVLIGALVGNFSNISVIKMDSPDPVNVSSNLTYQINVTSNGNGTAFNMTVNDTYPAQVIFLASQPAAVSGTNNTFIVGNLTAKANFSINITVLVLNITNGTVINNSVNTTFQNETSATLSRIAAQNTTVLNPPLFNLSNLSVVKADSPDPVDASSNLTYRIQVNSTGNGTAYNVTVNDTYPTEVVFLTSQPAAVTGTNNTFTLGNLTPGTNISINITVLVLNITNGTVINNSVNVTFQNETSALLSRIATANTTVIFNRAPTIAQVILNTTNVALNDTDQNLTEFIINATDPDNDSVRNITNFFRNNQSFDVANLPFEANSLSSVFTRDYSTVGNNGTVSGAVFNATGGVDGFGAYMFGGSSIADAVVMNTTGILNGSTTFMAWVKPRGYLATEQYIFGHTTQPAFANRIQLYTVAGQLRIGLGNAHFLANDSNLSVGAWYHVALVLNSTNFTVYINGTQTVSGNFSGLASIAGSMDVGNDGNSAARTESWNGTIDEMLIFNRTLSAQQIGIYAANRTNIVVSQELRAGEIWQACATPNDRRTDGATVCSNNVTIRAAARVSVINLSPFAGQAFLLNDTVNITANASVTTGLIDTVLANITLPNGTVVQVRLFNATKDLFNNTFNSINLTQRGRYNITFFANDTFNTINATTTTFFIRNAKNIIDVVDGDLIFINFTVALGTNTSGLLLLNITPNASVGLIQVFNHSEASPFDILRLGAAINESTFPLGGNYTIDASGFNYTQLNVTRTATDGDIAYVCAFFNSTTQTCIDLCPNGNDTGDCPAQPGGLWTPLANITPGLNYTFIIVNDTYVYDPGFGEWNSSQRNDEINTTSTTPVSAIQANITPSPGQYVVIGYGELQGSSQASDVRSRLILNNTLIVGNLSWQPDTSRTSNPPGDYAPFFTQDLINLSSNAQNLSMQFFTSNAANPVFIRRARSIILKVNNSDAQMNDSGDNFITLAPANTFLSIVNMSFRPSINQSLLVLATAEITPNSTNDSVFARLLMNGTEVGLAELEGEAASDIELFATHLFVNATANVTQNFTLQAQSENVANKSIRRARVTVIPLGEVFANASEGISETTSAVLQNKTFLFFNLTVPRDVLIIATASANISSATNGNFLGVDLAVDGVSMGNMTMGASDVTDMFSFITTEQQSLTNGTHTVRLGFNRQAGAAGTVAIRRARITVIPLAFNHAPTIAQVILNTTNPALNDTNQNLTVFVINASDLDGDPVQNITDWRMNNTGNPNLTSIAFLNMPFETSTNGNVSARIRDYSTMNNNGTLDFGNLTGAPTWIPNGQVGGAYDFDGINDFINTTSGADGDALKTTDNFTLTVWFKTRNTLFATFMLWEGLNGANGFGNGVAQTDQEMNFGFGNIINNSGAGLSVNNTLTFFLGDTSLEVSADILDVSVNFTDTQNWTFAAVAVTNMNTAPAASMYVNGVLVANDTGTTARTNRSNWNATFRIGRPGTATRFFNGTLDEVITFNRTLSPAQINRLYLDGNASRHMTTVVTGETKAGDVWQTCVTPNDRIVDGNTVCSNNVTIVQALANISNLSVIKIDTPDPVNTSSNLSYTITVTSTGTMNVSNATVNDTYPAEVIFLTAQPTPLAGTNNTFILGNMTPNQSILVNITVFVRNITNGTVINNSVNTTFQNDTGANLSVIATQATTVITPPGILTVVLLSPVPNMTTNITQNATFTVSANISCTDGTGSSCGNVTAFARYNATVPAGIKRVIQGSSSINATTQNVPIGTDVASGSSALFFSVRESADNPEGGSISGNILNSTHLRFFRPNATPALDVQWYVAEFESDVIVSRGDGVATNPEAAIPIGRTINTSASFIIPGGVNNGGMIWGDDDFVRFRIINATHVGLFLSGGVGDEVTQWQVVEFNGSFVQRNNLTMPSATTLLTVNLSTPVNVSRSFLTLSYQVAAGTVQPSNGAILGRIVNSTQIEFVRNSTSVVAQVAWEVTELPPGNTVQHAVALFGTTDTEANATLTPVNTSKAVAFASSGPIAGLSGGNSTFSDNDTPGHALFTLNITNSTNLRMTRVPTGSVAGIGWFVVEFTNSTREGFVNISTLTGATPFFTTSANPQFCILAANQFCQVNWTVNATGDINATFKINVNATSNESTVMPAVSDNAIVRIIAPVRQVTLINLSPFAGQSFLLNDTVNITVNATSRAGLIDTVLANITLPNGTVVQVRLFNATKDLFNNTFNSTNLTQRGRYNITFFANDTQTNVNATVTTFFIRRALNVVDVRTRLNDEDTDILDLVFMNYSVTVVGNASDILNLSLTLNNSRVKALNITLHNGLSPFDVLDIDDWMDVAHTPENTFATYGIDMTSINFSNLTFTVNASGQKLAKCANWNFTGQDCLGSFAFFQNISPGSNYTFTLGPGDPGFSESSAAVDIGLAPFDNESFVIAFINNQTSNVVFKLMQTNGTVLVNDTVVESGANDQSRVSIAAINFTHFAIAWFNVATGNGSRQIFNKTGTNTTGVRRFSTVVGPFTDVSVAQLGDRFPVCFANDSNNDASFQIFNDSNASQVVGDTSADTNIAPALALQNLVSCSGINATRSVFFWFDDSGNDVIYVILNETGGNQSLTTTLDNTVGETGQVAVASLDNNKEVFVWYDSSDDDITFATRDVNNNVIFGPTDIDRQAGTSSRVAVAAVRLNDTTQNDSFVVAWYNQSSNRIMAAVYNSTANTSNVYITVDTQPNTNFQLLEVTARDPITGNSLCPGKFVVAYSNSTNQSVFKAFDVNGSSWDGVCGQPDLQVNGSSIFFNVTNPREGENITINGTVCNIGTRVASNFNVTFVDGINASAGGVRFANLSGFTLTRGQCMVVNATYISIIGNRTINVFTDPENVIPESNESNNIGTKELDVQAYTFYLGKVRANLTLNDAAAFTNFQWNHTDAGNVYFFNSNSQFNFSTLQALGRNTTNGTSINDFAEANIALNMTNFNDSIQFLWATDNSTPKVVRNFTIFGRLVQNVPVINSSNTSSFVTGILWDTAGDTNGQYDLVNNETLVFITNINLSKSSQFTNNSDYEARVPSLLRSFRQPINQTVFTAELT